MYKNDQDFIVDILNLLQSIKPPDLPVYLVGGAVRDWVANRPIHDLDFVMPTQTRGLGRRLAKALSANYFVLDDERESVRVMVKRENEPQFMLDLVVYVGDSLEDDLHQRDYTVNAIAMDITQPQVWIDPLNGIKALHEKQLIPCSEQSMLDDPVRALRGIRLSQQMGLSISPAAHQQILAAATKLAACSIERNRDELFKILALPDPENALRLMGDFGLLQVLFPDMDAVMQIPAAPPHEWGLWEHSLKTVKYLKLMLNHLQGIGQVLPNPTFQQSFDDQLGGCFPVLSAALAGGFVDNRPNSALLLLAGLCHDMGKPATEIYDDAGLLHFYGHDQHGADLMLNQARHLALSVDEGEWLAKIIRSHMAVHHLAHSGEITRKACHRFFKNTAEAGLLVCLLSLADVLAARGDKLPEEIWRGELMTCRALMDCWVNCQAQVINPPVLVNGHEIMHMLQLKPSPKIGGIMKAIEESQVEGVLSTRDDVIQFIFENFRNEVP